MRDRKLEVWQLARAIVWEDSPNESRLRTEVPDGLGEVQNSPFHKVG